MFFPKKPVTDRLHHPDGWQSSPGKDTKSSQGLAQIKPEFPTLRCAIIGEGQDQSYSPILHANWASPIKFLSRSPGSSTVATAMRECTIFALPAALKPGLRLSRSDGFSETRDCLRRAGHWRIIQHGKNGWLIPIDGISEMADALRQLLCSPDLRTCSELMRAKPSSAGLHCQIRYAAVRSLPRRRQNHDAANPSVLSSTPAWWICGKRFAEIAAFVASNRASRRRSAGSSDLLLLKIPRAISSYHSAAACAQPAAARGLHSLSSAGVHVRSNPILLLDRPVFM